MDEIIYKKFYRKADKHLNGKIEAKHGKRNNQKMKPYLVLQYLLKNTDENHTQSAYDIMEYLDECGISAERRSVYRDIEDINKANLIIEQDCTIEEAEEILAGDEYDEEKLIVYDKKQKGFYVPLRHFEFDDIRLLAECVYTSKFISENKSKKLVDVVCEFVSDHQAEKIKHNAFLTNRVKTNNNATYGNIMTINQAMSTKIEGKAHEPEKIRFKYLKHTVEDVTKLVERRNGEMYVVSPFQIIINEGNYYLLGFDDKKKKMLTYRIDRMKGVQFTDIPREGEEVFKEIDLKSYTQRVFSMYSGNEKRVTIRFINKLLDTAIERFGANNAQYSEYDKNHFTVTAKVETSKQFFGWLLGFGNEAKIISPPEVVEEFTDHMDKVKGMY